MVRTKVPDGYLVGTGFLIAPNFLATASHVIPQDHNFNESVDLVRSIDLFPGRYFEKRSTLSAKLHCRNVSADVAILSVENPTAIECIEMMGTTPKSGSTVITRGFPEGGRVAGLRTSTPISGVIHVNSKNETFHTIEVAHQVHGAGDWEGYSGAPVVDPNTGLALGMVVRARPAFSGCQYLEALSVEFLLSLSEFRTCLGPTDNFLLGTIKKSRICALIASGDNLVTIARDHEHKDWFMADINTLIINGLVKDCGDFQLAPVTRLLIEQIDATVGFDYVI